MSQLLGKICRFHLGLLRCHYEGWYSVGNRDLEISEVYGTGLRNLSRIESIFVCIMLGELENQQEKEWNIFIPYYISMCRAKQPIIQTQSNRWFVVIDFFEWAVAVRFIIIQIFTFYFYNDSCSWLLIITGQALKINYLF